MRCIPKLLLFCGLGAACISITTGCSKNDKLVASCAVAASGAAVAYYKDAFGIKERLNFMKSKKKHRIPEALEEEVFLEG